MAGANTLDIAVDIEEALPKIAEMSWCHQSQIAEWLPWVGRHDMAPPKSLADWSVALRQRFEIRQRKLGVESPRLLEFFNVTAWGAVPTYEQILKDLPNIVPQASNLERLKERLVRFS